MNRGPRERFLLTLITALLVSTFVAPSVRAASWNGIQPFKSRREEVIKILGSPIAETSEGVLRFAVAGGSVAVSFASEKFVAAKKLKPQVAGTVLEIVLQHEHSSDTPESLKLLENRDFVREDSQSVSIFRSNKTGVVYTFVNGVLRTTRFTASETELARARR